VPAGGYFGGGWSPGTTLLLYWIEGILIAGLISVRIVLHRRATRKRGHYRASKTSRTRGSRETLLRSFLGVVIPFTLAHGVFLLPILFLFLPQMEAGKDVGVRLVDLRIGLIGIGAFLSVGLLFDLFGLGQRPFRWIEQLVERSLGRVAIVHLSIVLGMAALAFWEAPRTFFIVFVVLKTTSDLSWMLPQSKVANEPPGWLAWMDQLGKGKDGETFVEYWQRTHAEENRMRRQNEEIMPAAPRSKS
jgi:hypothetical protein